MIIKNKINKRINALAELLRYIDECNRALNYEEFIEQVKENYKIDYGTAEGYIKSAKKQAKWWENE